MAIAHHTPQQVQSRPLSRVYRLPSGGVTAAALLIAAAALLPVVQSSNATTTGHRIRELEAEKAAAQASIHSLETSVAQLGSLERIDREARDRLGMAPAGRTVMVAATEPAPPTRRVPARYLPLDAGRPQPSPPGGVRGFLTRLRIP